MSSTTLDLDSLCLCRDRQLVDAASEISPRRQQKTDSARQGARPFKGAQRSDPVANQAKTSGGLTARMVAATRRYIPGVMMVAATNIVHFSFCVNVEGCCEASDIRATTSATGRGPFNRVLYRGKRVFERRARSVDDDLPNHRALDAGQPFLLRAPERQQIEAVRGGRRSIVDAHRQVQRGMEVVRRVRCLIATTPKSRPCERPR